MFPNFDERGEYTMHLPALIVLFAVLAFEAAAVADYLLICRNALGETASGKVALL